MSAHSYRRAGGNSLDHLHGIFGHRRVSGAPVAPANFATMSPRSERIQRERDVNSRATWFQSISSCRNHKSIFSFSAFTPALANAVHSFCLRERCRLLHRAADEFHNIPERRAGLKHSAHALAFEFAASSSGTMPYDDASVIFFYCEAPSRAARWRCAPERMDRPITPVFLERGVDDHFWRLAESGIDHLHASIAQRPGDYLGAAIMSVEAGFCHQHPDSRIHTLRELTGTRRNATQGQGGEFSFEPRTTQKAPCTVRI